MAGNFKACYCHTCKKGFHSLGIMRHRAMHRDKKEDCCITYGSGKTWTHHFSMQEKLWEDTFGEHPMYGSRSRSRPHQS